MTIQRATKEDIPYLVDMDEKLNTFRSLHFKKETKDFHKRVHDYELFNETDLEKSIVFIAQDGQGEAVGFVRGTVYIRKNHQLSKAGYIDELFVDEKTRGSGVACELILKLEQAFKDAGCLFMSTQTDAENKLSRGFYHKIGMSEVTVEYWKPL